MPRHTTNCRSSHAARSVRPLEQQGIGDPKKQDDGRSTHRLQRLAEGPRSQADEGQGLRPHVQAVLGIGEPEDGLETADQGARLLQVGVADGELCG